MASSKSIVDSLFNDFIVPKGAQLQSTYVSIGTIREKKLVFPTQNASGYTQGQRITFDLSSESQFLDLNDTHLMFDMAIATNDGAPDGSASSLINQMVISMNGMQIENIERYNVLHAMLSDLLFGPAHRTLLASSQGYSHEYATASNITIPAGEFAFHTIPVSITRECNEEIVAAAATKRFEIPLLGMFGASFYLPLPFLPRMTVDFYLETNAMALFGTDAQAPAFTLNNVALKCEFLTFNPDFMDKYAMLVAGNQIKLPWNTWVNHQSIVPTLNANTQWTQLITKTYEFLNSSLTCFRTQTTQIGGAKSVRKISARYNPTMTAFQLLVGSKMVPQRPIAMATNNTAEALSETYKAVNMNMMNVFASGSVIDAVTLSTGAGCDRYYDIVATLGQIAPVAAGAAAHEFPRFLSKFCLGYNFATHPAEGISSGINTKKSGDFISLQFTGTWPNEPVVCDTYFNVDCFLHVLPDRQVAVQM
jgi:hypothetical protein